MSITMTPCAHDRMILLWVKEPGEVFWWRAFWGTEGASSECKSPWARLDPSLTQPRVSQIGRLGDGWQTFVGIYKIKEYHDTAVFVWAWNGNCVCFWCCIALLCDSRHSHNQWEANPKPITTCTGVYSALAGWTEVVRKAPCHYKLSTLLPCVSSF